MSEQTHEEWWAERDMAFQIQAITLYGTMLGVSVGLSVVEHEQAYLVGGGLCLLGILMSLQAAGQYRYDPTTNTVEER